MFSQVWWVKSVLWTSWWPKRLNVGRKLLPTPNWSLLWLKRLLMQVCKLILLSWMLKLSKCNHFQCCLTCSFVLLQLMNWLWLRVTVWKSAYSTLPLPRWVESQSEGGGCRLWCWQSNHDVCACVVPCRMTVKRAWQHLWRRERPVSRTSRKKQELGQDHKVSWYQRVNSLSAISWVMQQSWL